MSQNCILRTETGNNIQVNYGTTVKLEANPDIEMYNLEPGRVLVKNRGDSSVLLNGYKIVKDEDYKIECGDCLRIDESVRYFLELDTRKRRSRSSSPEAKPKKTKLAPIFQAKQSPKNLNLSGNGSWETIQDELLIYTPRELVNKSEIACFDMDNTLIKTKSGKTFPTDWKDWILFSPNVPSKLRKYHEEGYKLVIFTNQLHVGKNKQEIGPFKEKVNLILKDIGCPVQVFAALKKDIYRKPAPGMWNVLNDEKNGDFSVNVDKSFYVGDAAGRVEEKALKRKKDHSFADRLFALNIGLKFLTPEEFFMGAQPRKFTMPQFDPRKFDVPGDVIKFSDEQEVIMMVGCPASGKSTFCERELKPRGYVYVSRDQLGSWNMCVKHLENALKEKKCVVIDNTNKDKATRKRYLAIAQHFNVPCRCFVVDTTKDMARHNNRFREITDNKHKPVTDIILHSHFKSFEVPSVTEGFTEIVRVGFIPNFTKPELEKLYRMFLLDK